MLTISGTPDCLDIVSPMPWGKRVLFALLSVVPFLAPYELILQVQWTDYLNPFFLFAVAVSAGAIVVSAFLLFAAVAALGCRMTFDAARSTFTYSEAAPVVRRRTRVFPLASVERVEIRSREWSDGAPTFALEVTVSGGVAFESGSSCSRADVERDKDRVVAFLNRAREGRAGRIG